LHDTLVIDEQYLDNCKAIRGLNIVGLPKDTSDRGIHLENSWIYCSKLKEEKMKEKKGSNNKIIFGIALILAVFGFLAACDNSTSPTPNKLEKLQKYNVIYCPWG